VRSSSRAGSDRRSQAFNIREVERGIQGVFTARTWECDHPRVKAGKSLTRAAVTPVDTLVTVREGQRPLSQPPWRSLKLFPKPYSWFHAAASSMIIDAAQSA
jgi:hypothetical protein